MRKVAKDLLTCALTVGLIGGCSPQNPTVDLASNWEISTLQPTGVIGVSPELLVVDGTTTLIVTSLSEKKYWTSDNDSDFSPQQISMPPGADYTAIKQTDGSWRLYFSDFAESMGQAPPSPDSLKAVFTMTTTDFVSFSPGRETGVAQDNPGRAWGVPDTIVGPDGLVYMYWVDEVEGERWEVIRLATSSDGVNFQVREEPVIFDGYVDPFVMKAEDGDWLMLLSTTPHPSELPQKLHLARSNDGIAWEVDPNPLLEEGGWNYLDPSAIPQGNSWLVVASRVREEEAHNPEAAEIFVGTLSEVSE